MTNQRLENDKTLRKRINLTVENTMELLTFVLGTTQYTYIQNVLIKLACYIYESLYTYKLRIILDMLKHVLHKNELS